MKKTILLLFCSLMAAMVTGLFLKSKNVHASGMDNKILFFNPYSVSCTDFVFNLSLYDSSSGSFQNLKNNCHEGGAMSVSPNEDKILWVENIDQGSQYTLHIYDIETGIITKNEDISVECAHFNPDGDILFTDDTDGVFKKMDINKNTVSILAAPVDSDYKFAEFWISSNFEKVVMLQEKEICEDYESCYYTSLVMMNADGTGQHVILQDVLGDYNFGAWKRDGSGFFYWYHLFNTDGTITNVYVYFDLKGPTPVMTQVSNGGLVIYDRLGNALELFSRSLLDGTTFEIIADIKDQVPSLYDGAWFGRDTEGRLYVAGSGGTGVKLFDSEVYIPVASDPPELIFPLDGATNQSQSTELKTGAFSDPNPGNTHLKTEWQISDEDDFSHLVFHNISQVHLVSIKLPDLMLLPATQYYWRARFYDNSGLVSSWSGIRSFTTEDGQDDQNADGIPDALENKTVDLDNDGIKDIDQDDIKTLNTVVGNGQMGLSIKQSFDVTDIARINSIDPDTISECARPKDIELGLFSFNINVANAGDAAEVVVYFSTAAPADAKWYVYNSVDKWVDYSDHAVFSMDRKSVTLGLKDGDYGDADGTANGVIVDPCCFGIASWLKGKVIDANSQAGVSNCSLTVADLDLSFSTLSDGSYISMLLPGTYDILASAPGYQSYNLTGIKIDEAVIVTQDISLTSNTGIQGVSITGDPETGNPMTFSVEGNTTGPSYYRFSVHPDYGTFGYDGIHWSLMTDSEYVTDNSCDYTFTSAGKYIVVVWLTPSTENVVAQGIPIVGWSVDTGYDTCRTNFKALSISGTQKVNMPLTFSVTAENHCCSQLYYRFSVHPDYGTSGYDGNHWQLMTDTEWITRNSLDYTFTQPGKYIVVVWVSDTEEAVDAAGIPIIGWSVDIK